MTDGLAVGPPASRILVLNPYGTGEYSGPAVFAERLFQAVQAAGRTVTFLGRTATPWADRSFRAWGVGQLGPRGQVLWALQAALLVVRLHRSVDVVHVHGCYLFSLVPTAAARLFRVPYVLLPLMAGGDLAAQSTSKFRAASRIRRSAVSHAAAGLALAPEVLDELAWWGLPRSRAHRTFNAVDLSRVLAVERPRNSALQTIGFVGKVGARKGAIDLLRAVAELAPGPEGPPRALFVGPFESQQFEREFWSEARRLGIIDQVHVTGYVSDVQRWLAKEMIVFALPSRGEGLPGALCEAMCAGLPVVTTSSGAMAEVVGASGAGFVHPVGDVGELSWSLGRLLADEDLWLECSVAGRRYGMSHFSSGAVAQQYLSLISTVSRKDQIDGNA